MMTKRFYRYILPIKLFCVALSIFFLREGFSGSQITQMTQIQTMIVMDREDSSLNDNKNFVIQYITEHSFSSYGLVTYASGEFSLILPATNNTQILTTYIQSISPAGKTTTPPASYLLYDDSESSFLVMSNNDKLKKLFSEKKLTSLVSGTDNNYTQGKTKNLTISSLLFLLALFL